MHSRVPRPQRGMGNFAENEPPHPALSRLLSKIHENRGIDMKNDR
jgi:hypothetical protein